MFLKVSYTELIALDFDHTIFKTTEFVDDAQKLFRQRFNISESDFHSTRDDVKDCCVVIDVDTFVAKLPHRDKDGMHSALLELLQDNKRKYTYSDAFEFIEQHRKSFDIALVTHGDKELQIAKIKASGLPKSIPYLITKDLKSELLKPYVNDYKKIHFIDDKPSNVEDVKEKFPEIEVYFMQRAGDTPYGEKGLTCNCQHQKVTGLDFKIDLSK